MRVGTKVVKVWSRPKVGEWAAFLSFVDFLLENILLFPDDGKGVESKIYYQGLTPTIGATPGMANAVESKPTTHLFLSYTPSYDIQSFLSLHNVVTKEPAADLD